MIYQVVFSDGRSEEMALTILEAGDMLKRPDVQSVIGLTTEKEIEEIAKQVL
ncbi:hypothetical protein [Serratia marcescens]|uniref:hypothetical protein n=1 Tax=Serratia marcescens TaxID=615 RepID=UPI001F15523F|nr:hypothetical protein [Serratia marcescens]MDP8728344.1 hypothetical protein [Serratia marcescens]